MGLTEEHKQTFEDGVTTLHDYFDQFRFKHNDNGNPEGEAGAKQLQQRLEDAEKRYERGDYSGAQDALNALRSVRTKLERADDIFDWNSDPVVDDHYVAMQAALDVLQSVSD